MVLRKKLSLMLAASAISALALVGCSSTGDKAAGGKIDAATLLANKDARAAINMAFDKQQLCDVILNNGSTPAGYLMAKGLATNDDGKDYREVAGDMGYSFDADKAKESWEKAKKELGFETADVELLTFDSETSKKLAEFIQAQLKQNLEGLNVTIKQQPFKQKLELEQNGQFDLSFSGWSPDYPDPLTFLETMMSGTQYGKQTGYNNEKYDKLIEEAKAATTQEESWKKFAEAEKMMLEDGFLAPIYQKGASYLEKDYVKGRVTYTYGVPAAYQWVEMTNGKKELNITQGSDIPTLDISKAADTVSSEVLANVMEGLVRVDGNGEALPGMAESWEKLDGGTKWVFHLRKDAKWSNGDPVTAKDFEYSWKRTLDPATASTYGFIMYDIVGAQDYNLDKNKDASSVGVKATDDYTLEVNLVRPVHYFDKLMYFKSFLPQNEKFVKAQGDKYGTTKDAMVFNGPFTLTDWKIEDQYIMTKNAGYWNASTVKIDKVNTKIVKDVNAAVNLYEAGQIDVVGLSSEHVDKYKNASDFKTREDAGVFFLQINGGNNKK